MKFRFPACEEIDPVTAAIEAWFDPSRRAWLVSARNEAGDQTSEVHWAGTRPDAVAYVKALAKDHPGARIVTPRSFAPYL